MTGGYDRPLYILAFDHRTSFIRRLFGVIGDPTPAEHAHMRAAKQVILTGLLAAGEILRRETIGALVDEELGAEAARRARESGVLLAMCAETSSAREFNFQYGDAYARHIEEFAPDFVKVLVRYNPEGDAELNRRQAMRLALLSDWLAEREQKLLFELIVPFESEQLRSVETEERFAAELRPQLMAAAIAELQQAGVEPDVWKVEGLEAAKDCELVAHAARAHGRDRVGCIVLGAGAPEQTVAHWLRQAAGTSGFIGFAIGRTIWWDALDGWRRQALSSAEAAAIICANYTRTVALYAGAEASSGCVPDAFKEALPS